MRYALFEFIDEDNEHGNGLSIGESSWISDLDEKYHDNETFDFGENMEVNWRDKGKFGTSEAKVHRFSDIRSELVELTKKLTKESDSEGDKSLRGRRLKKKKFSDGSEEELDVKVVTTKASKTKKKTKSEIKSGKALIDKIKEDIIRPEITPVDEPVAEKPASVLVAQLTEENSKLKLADLSTVVANMKEIPALVHDLKKARGSQTIDLCATPRTRSRMSLMSKSPSPALSTAPQSPMMSKSPSPVLSTVSQSPIIIASVEEDDSQQIEHKVITQAMIKRSQSADPRKMVNNLMSCVFDQSYLSSHSLTGSSQKSAMEPGILAQIIAIISQQFPGYPTVERDTRRFITEKFNNSTKKKTFD